MTTVLLFALCLIPVVAFMLLWNWACEDTATDSRLGLLDGFGLGSLCDLLGGLILGLFDGIGGFDG